MENAKLLVSLDWLSISFVITDRQDYEREAICLNEWNAYTVERLSGTNVFSSRFVVYDYKGRKVLTWLADPKSGMLNQNLCLIEFANFSLYTGEWKLLFENLSRFHNGFVHRISRIDICGDFQYYNYEGNGYAAADVLASALYHSHYYVQGKGEGSAFYYYEKNGGLVEQKIKQLSWGGKTSKFKWKFYNKTLEIDTVSKKDYIKKLWKRSGFDINKDTWRIECSIVKASSLSIKDVAGEEMLDINKISENENLVRLYKALVFNKFRVRKNQMQKNSSRNEFVDIFDIKCFDCNFSVIESYNNYGCDEAKSFIRKAVKSIQDTRVNHVTNMVDNLLNVMQSILDELDMHGWFEEQNGISFNNFCFFAMEKRRGTKFMYDLLYKDYEEETKDLNKQLTLF